MYILRDSYLWIVLVTFVGKIRQSFHNLISERYTTTKATLAFSNLKIANDI